MARMASASASPSPASMNGPLSPAEKPEQLKARLDGNGVIRLAPDRSDTNSSWSNGPRSLKRALDEAARTRPDSEASETDSLEDYDSMKLDPMTVVNGGKGGGYVGENGVQTPDAKPDKVYGKLQIPSEQRPGVKRLKSIPVTLDKLQEKGRYVLTADDDALREILKTTAADYTRHHNPDSPKRRNKFSDLVFTRQFTAFDRQNRASANSPFHGFFTLFWLAVGVFVTQLAAENWMKYGNILGTNEIMRMAFHRDVMVLGLSDGVMCGLGTGIHYSRAMLDLVSGVAMDTYFYVNLITYFLGESHHSLKNRICTALIFNMVFFVLHGIVMLMKQHSYAFYNGHLSEEYKTRKMLLTKLKQLEDLSPCQTPSATVPSASSLSTSYLDHKPTPSDVNQRLYERRHSLGDALSTTDQVAAAIGAGEPLDLDQIQTFARILKWEIDVLTEELKGKSTVSGRSYPNNLTVSNHYEYIVLPTLVYELEYPRSDRINWYYVAEKAAGIVGLLGIMNLISQSYIYPVVVRTIEMKEMGMPLDQRLYVFPSIISDLAFPFLAEYILTWYVIWECILNLLAELTFFADRGFYADWWNSVSWDQFARDWNRPVHNFLLRHVYHSSISSMRINKFTATLITFFLSACVHELVMWCLFKKLRGYLLFLQMMQLPLVSLSRTRWLKGKATLGNVIFWIGIFTGPSLLCSLYLVI
ncbi:MBOAT family protein [Rutstroemia sp. NJR-2017a BBW]|nr:MBOAT family protein [Rutstroemia sp. NJR-2017a BBW]